MKRLLKCDCQVCICWLANIKKDEDIKYIVDSIKNAIDK